MRRRLTLIGAMMMHKGEADGPAPAVHRPGHRASAGAKHCYAA
jgi:hypothetical protein